MKSMMDFVEPWLQRLLLLRGDSAGWLSVVQRLGRCGGILLLLLLWLLGWWGRRMAKLNHSSASWCRSGSCRRCVVRRNG